MTEAADVEMEGPLPPPLEMGEEVSGTSPVAAEPIVASPIEKIIPSNEKEINSAVKRGRGRPRGAVCANRGSRGHGAANPISRPRGRPKATTRSAGRGRGQTTPPTAQETKKRKTALTTPTSAKAESTPPSSKREDSATKKRRGPGRPPRSASDGKGSDKPAAKSGPVVKESPPKKSKVSTLIESESTSASSSPMSNGSGSPIVRGAGRSRGRPGRPRGRGRGGTPLPAVTHQSLNSSSSSSPLVEPMDEIEKEMLKNDETSSANEITPRKIHKKFGKFRSLANANNESDKSNESSEVNNVSSASTSTPTPTATTTTTTSSSTRPIRKSSRIINQPNNSSKENNSQSESSSNNSNTSSSNVPMKVKSRWRRSSELETSVQSDHSSDEPLVPINSYLKDSKNLKKLTISDINNSPKVKAELAERLKSFQHISESRWLCER